ncbi:MAG: DUF808 domain-containing protein [Flavobacteriaceae bacterium]|nr:DUF808 domain-containing protein [Flavobacteriaceae bacterium]
MASGIFAVLDDIAVLMDDVAVASKIATKKTAGILGDDLAVNADKATGFVSSRELPVLWAITKGSFINKLIIVPVALLLNYFLPIAVKIILIIGGLYLAYEGIEKIIHWIFQKKHEHTLEKAESSVEAEELEKSKIKSAVSTDFILSVEIVIIALGSVLDRSLMVQILTVAVVSIIATVGVYGLVALIVRMDDFGYKLIKTSRGKGILRHVGRGLVMALPVVIRILGVVGTIALILVAGGIFKHNIDYFHDFLPNIPSLLSDAILGILGGLISFGIFSGIQKVWKLRNH